MGCSNTIETRPAPDLVPHPTRFRVKVKRRRLVGLVLRELLEYRGNLRVALSRPCVYGVFSGPLGGLAPRERLCVGCLRCTVEHPEVVQILNNPARDRLGDSYLRPDDVETLLYEARTGRIPVRGAGYRGPFGGQGWDALWTDMSEIVRPTRDGIHGREFISTEVDVGEIPPFLRFDGRGEPEPPVPRLFTIGVPFFFDLPPPSTRSPALFRVLAEAARRAGTVAFLPAREIDAPTLHAREVVPLLAPGDRDVAARIGWEPRMLALDGFDAQAFAELQRRLPRTIVAVRVPMDADVPALVRQGVRVLHLVADYHGRAAGRFARDVILRVHRELVAEGLREGVTLLGGGGITLAEHVPKALLCGLDAASIETAACAALQARFLGDCRDRESARVLLPPLDLGWAVQRLTNLAAAWRDQLLEFLGAMGMREVRRLRGEIGRCMFQEDLERDAFSGIATDEARTN